MAQFTELLGGVFHGVILHQAAVDLLHAEQLAHMEAHLLLVLLLIGAMLLHPLDDVLHLGTAHAVLFEGGQNVRIEQSLVQRIHISLGPQTDPLEARVFGGLDPLFKGALIAQRPRADRDGVFLRHVKHHHQPRSVGAAHLGQKARHIQHHVVCDAEGDHNDRGDHAPVFREHLVGHGSDQLQNAARSKKAH